MDDTTVNYQETTRQKSRAAISSILAALLLTGAKLGVALVTGSLGVLSEALHSLVDLLGTILSFAAVRVSDRPPDATHPYGHAKYESLAALFAVFLLAITAIGILREAWLRVSTTQVVPNTNLLGMGVIFLAIVVDFTRSRYLRRIAQKHGSEALAADATHFTTDLFSSVAVLSGLIIVAVGTEFRWPHLWLVLADAGAGAIVAVIILILASQLAVRAVDSLSDRVPPDLVQQVEQAVGDHDDRVGRPSARVRFVGNRPYADISFGVRRGLSLERTEEISNKVIEQVRKILPHADVVVHPIPQATEAESIVDAAIITASRLNLGVHHVRAFHTPRGIKIDMHMEVPSTMTLQAAHDQADRLEDELRREIPGVEHVEVHIEPRHEEFHELSKTDSGRILTEVLAAANNEIGGGIHDIQVLVGEQGYVVSLHCYLPADMPIVDAHARTAEIEKAIRDHVKGVYRVTVHPEPAYTKATYPLQPK